MTAMLSAAVCLAGAAIFAAADRINQEIAAQLEARAERDAETGLARRGVISSGEIDD